MSHRLLKWLIGYNLLLSGLFLLLALLTAFPPVPVLSAIIIVALAFAALLALKVRMAQQVLAMLMSFAGTSLGGLALCTG